MSLSSPQEIMERLAAIEQDLAQRQNELEAAALGWYRAKRERERVHAQAILSAEGTVPEKQAQAALAVCELGRDEEARYEAHKAVVRVLETRATIGQSLLRAQGRAA